MKSKALNIFKHCALNRNYLEGKSDFYVNATHKDCMIVNDQESFDLAIDSFMSLKVAKDFSPTMVIITIRRVLLSCKEIDDSVLNTRVDLFVKYLCELEIRDHRVLKVFHGVNINGSDSPVTFENLTMYDLPKHDNYLKSLYDHDVKHKFNQKHEMIVAECLVKAKDHWKALELSNSTFNKFELLLAFLLNEQHKEFSVGILRMNFSPHQSAIISFEGGVMASDEENKNFVGNLDISTLEKYLPDNHTKSYESLLKVVLSPVTVLDKKISSAIEWVGESYMDTNKASSYLKAVIALEALLKLDEKGVITASIMSSIAEQCAFLNGNTADECIAIERKVKRIYAERSKIAHTGTSSVSMARLRSARAFVSITILKLIALKNELALKNPEDFQSFLRKKKYQGGALSN